MGIIQAICISEVRGVQKHAIPEADLTPEWGIVGDAHGGNWHRQVSLLGLEKIEAFRAKGADVAYGAFGENLVVDGFDFRTLPVGTLLAVLRCVCEGYDGSKVEIRVTGDGERVDNALVQVRYDAGGVADVGLSLQTG